MVPIVGSRRPPNSRLVMLANYLVELARVCCSDVALAVNGREEERKEDRAKEKKRNETKEGKYRGKQERKKRARNSASTDTAGVMRRDVWDGTLGLTQNRRWNL